MKIRTYLVLMALAILIPVAIFSTVALKMLLDSERTAALRGLHETARATALIVDRELSSAEAALRVLGSSPHLVSGDLSAFYTQAKMADRGPGTWTLLLDANGKQIINTLVPFGTPLPSTITPNSAQAIRSQKAYVSDLITSMLTGKLVTTVSVPATIENGHRYVVEERFSAEYFQRVITQRQVPATWLVAVIDNKGNFIARSKRSEVLVGKPARPELVAAARTSAEGGIRHNTLENVESYDVFTHSAVSGWTIAVAAPVSLIESSAQRAVIVAASGLLAALLCAAGAAIWFGRRLVLAVNRATVSADALGRGEAPGPVDSHVAEVDDLHTALARAGKILTNLEAERIKLFSSEQKARKLAEEQNKAKDEFLAMLGHELRNPISAISSAVSVIGFKGISADSENRAKVVVQRQAQHLGRIVDDLLDLSRVMSKKIVLNKKNLDLSMIVSSCVETLQATRRTAQYTLKVHQESTWIDADSTRVQQIVSNLLDNALKYTPTGGTIEIDVRPEGDAAVLIISDSGVGISAELLPNVFDVFIQGTSSLDRSQGGLGIGLSLVRELTGMHGGTVTAESGGAKRGSKFTVKFPLVPAPAPIEHADQTVLVVKSRPCSVLLIEDNADGRMMMSSVLALSGFHVLEAAEGSSGLLLAATEKPQVGVIDIGLPGIDGYEIARRLRANPATRMMGLIALTGYGNESDRRRALDAGFDIHLAKPADMDRLIEMINIFAERSGKVA